MATKPFSSERLFHIRRLRKARRLFRQAPLFAFDEMRQQYSGYTYREFMDDLRPRSRKRKRHTRNPLARYGRFDRMENLILQYRQTKETELALQALALRKHISQPYRVLARSKNFSLVFTLCPLIPIRAIEKLVTDLQNCKTELEACDMVQKCRDSHNFG